MLVGESVRHRKEGERQRQGAHLEEAELHFEQAELPALEARCRPERSAELHEVERRHGLEDRKLVHQQLRVQPVSDCFCLLLCNQQLS